jgi:DNA replication protein DnaC
MTDRTITDATILASLLTELRLPSIARNWKRITEAANREGWPAQKTLATLLEIEVAERASRRIQRHRDQSETPGWKNLRQLRLHRRAGTEQTAPSGARCRRRLDQERR